MTATGLQSIELRAASRSGGADAAERLAVAPLGQFPSRLAVGRGQAFFLHGTCSHPSRSIHSLKVVIGDIEQPVLAFGMPRPASALDGDYWWAIVSIPAIEEPQSLWVELVAELEDGTIASGRLGTLELVPALEAPPEDPSEAIAAARAGHSGEPSIAVCMATYEPPIDLFRRQIDSIREQTHGNWICLISDDASSPDRLEEMRAVIGDDARFVLSPAPENLGFYSNFERALTMVPESIDYVALCDQDDRWRPDKLSSLLAGLRPGTRLVYSDMRIVSEDDEVLFDTYWTFRRNNHTNFGSLVIANTVTGAASLFDRSLLEHALPFPPPQANAYHDHWIAQVAMALGGISYVDRPLYDYVQHGQAALGHLAANAFGRHGRPAVERLRSIRWRGNERRYLGWRTPYFRLYCRVATNVAVLRLRCGGAMSRQQARTLDQISDSTAGLIWLMARMIRSAGGRSETLGREQVMLKGLLWRRYARLRHRARGLRDRINERGRALRRSTPPAWQIAEPEGGDGATWLKPILVDYFTRDGSTLLMRLLASSPEIVVERSYPYERKYFAYLWRWSQLLDREDWPEDAWGPSGLGSLSQMRFEALMGPPPWYPRPLLGSVPGEPTMSQRSFELVWGEFSRRAAREHRAELGRKASEGPNPARFFAEKHLNTWKVPIEQLPPVQLLVLLRDPRDSWVSINAFNEVRGSGGLGRDQAGSAEQHLENVIVRQRERLRWIIELEEQGTVPIVRYEQLVGDLAGTAAELGTRLGVSFDTEAVTNDAALRKRHMTATSPEQSVGRWRREMDAAVAARFWTDLGPELAALGFSE